MGTVGFVLLRSNSSSTKGKVVFNDRFLLFLRVLNTTLFESWEIVGPYPSWWFFNLLLLLVQGLNCFWSYLIIKIACKAISRGKVRLNLVVLTCPTKSLILVLLNQQEHYYFKLHQNLCFFPSEFSLSSWNHKPEFCHLLVSSFQLYHCLAADDSQ